MIPLIITIAAFIILSTIGVSITFVHTYKLKHDDIKTIYDYNIAYQTNLEESYDKLGNKHNVLLEDYTSLSKKHDEIDMYSTNIKEQLDINTKIVNDMVNVNNQLKDDIKSMELLTGISVTKVKQDLSNESKSKQLDKVLVEVNTDIKERNISVKATNKKK